MPNPTGAAIQLGVAVLTAILLGNVTKEFAFDVFARLTLWSGRTFVRGGLTASGKTFWEVQFKDGTWMRCETESTQSICGRCNRLEVRPEPRDKAGNSTAPSLK